MRTPISLLAIAAFLVGCSTDEDSSITQTITVTSSPNSAIVRLNGSAVGRTPTTITVESNSDYQIEVAKGGYAPSLTELKPSLKTDSKGNMYYGFPERVSVSLDRIPGSDDVKVPEEDIKEFKDLAKKAVATNDKKVPEPGSIESKNNSVKEIQSDVTEAKNKLAARDTAATAKIGDLKKSLAEAKAADGAKVDETKIAALEAQIDAQEKAAAADRQSTAALLKALESRTDELVRLQKEVVTTAKAEATKEAEDKAKVEAAKQLEEQKAVAAKEAEEKARAEADKQLASVQRVMEEQKTLAAKAEEQRIAAEKQRAAAELEAKKRVYADFSSRYALLESRRRNKLISEEDFKEQLSELRKELTK